MNFMKDLKCLIYKTKRQNRFCFWNYKFDSDKFSFRYYNFIKALIMIICTFGSQYQ